MERERLLISDVDGTLLGDDAALRRFAAWLAPRRPQLGIVYASGRFYDSILESVRQTDLPEPDAVIGGVGTDIRLAPGGNVLHSWQAQMRVGWDPQRVRAALANIAGLEDQPPEVQSEFKVSYYLYDAFPEHLQLVRRRLAAAGIRAELIYSSRRDLDVLPHGVSKGTAAAFLAAHWGMPHEHVCVSGDSGNDRRLFEQGFRGIVVGNAHDELKALQGPFVYQARRNHAAGVQEGLEHWLDGVYESARRDL